MISIHSERRCVPTGDRFIYAAPPVSQLAAIGLPRTSESLLKIPPFNPTGVQLSEVHKTGLGSSAALITSVVCALLLHLRVVPPSSFSQDESEGRRLAHNLAQFVHCFAQGKIGSGFDVSSAVFGSQLYTRFDPTVLDPIMSEDVVWTFPFTLPRGILKSALAFSRPPSRHCFPSFRLRIRTGTTLRSRFNCHP